jgi:hypothetical protein
MAEADCRASQRDDHDAASGKAYRGQRSATEVGLFGSTTRSEIVRFALFKGGWDIDGASIDLRLALGKVVDFHQRRRDVEDVSRFVHCGTPKIVRCQMYDRAGAIPHECEPHRQGSGFSQTSYSGIFTL